MQKEIDFGIEVHTWPNPNGIPNSLRAAANVGTYNVNLLGALLSIGVFTRPPTRRGFDLSDFWAWMRYFSAFSSDHPLRLKEDWSTIDSHHKTVASSDFGVGFSIWILSDLLGFWDYVDVLHVVNVLAPNAFALRGNAGRGPRKSPDYIAYGPGSQISIVECKGSQSSISYLRSALGKGIQQKSNITAVGGQVFSNSLVSGIYVPKWESSSPATFLVCDPDKDDIKSVLFKYSTDQIKQASSRASMARDLAHFDLPLSVAALMGVKTEARTLKDAIQKDLAQDGIKDGGIFVQYQHKLAKRVMLNNLKVDRISFLAELPKDAIDNLSKPFSIEEIGKHLQGSRNQEQVSFQEAEGSVSYYSPNGVRFKLTLEG